MIDEKLVQLVKEFVKENSIDELRAYLAEKGYNFENKEEWKEMLRPIVREMGAPENQVEAIIENSFES